MSRKKQLANMEISELCSELGSIVHSGVSITDGIFILSQDDEDKKHRELLLDLLKSIENGSTVSGAFEKNGGFPDYFIEMIVVGEKTGRLDTVLISMAEYYERLADLSSSVKRAVIYPAVLLVTIFAVIIVLAVYVLPIFSDVFGQLGLTMSDSAMWVMNAGSAVSSAAVYVVGSIAFIVILTIVLYHYVPAVKKAVLTAVSHTKTARALYSARFANALYMLLSSGLDIDESMEMSKKLIENPRMREKIAECREKMNSGRPFADVLNEAEIFSKIDTRMITLGFGTGTLDTVMRDIARKTEDRVNDMIQTAVSRFEPAMIIIMTAAVGFILLSVMLPLLGIMSVIG